MTMSFINVTNSFSAVVSNNTKVLALEKSFQQGIENFKDLLIDFEQLQIESDCYKTQFTKQKEKCDRYVKLIWNKLEQNLTTMLFNYFENDNGIMYSTYAFLISELLQLHTTSISNDRQQICVNFTKVYKNIHRLLDSSINIYVLTFIFCIVESTKLKKLLMA